MYGEDAYAVRRIALYALLVQRLLPVVQQRTDVRHMVLQILRHIVAEGTEVCVLARYAVKFEALVQMVDKLHHG